MVLEGSLVVSSTLIWPIPPSCTPTPTAMGRDDDIQLLLLGAPEVLARVAAPAPRPAASAPDTPAPGGGVSGVQRSPHGLGHREGGANAEVSAFLSLLSFMRTFPLAFLVYGLPIDTDLTVKVIGLLGGVLLTISNAII